MSMEAARRTWNTISRIFKQRGAKGGSALHDNIPGVKSQISIPQMCQAIDMRCELGYIVTSSRCSSQSRGETPCASRQLLVGSLALYWLLPKLWLTTTSCPFLLGQEWFFNHGS
jgi:hypothetical protein